MALPAVVKTRILNSERELTQFAHSLERGLILTLNQHKDKLRRLSHSVALNASKTTAGELERVQMLKIRYANALKNLLKQPTMRLDSLESMVRVLSPQNTIKRGYSITMVNGKAVKSQEQLKNGDVIETRLFDGTVMSKIIDK